jgi:hypothetical protein
MSTRKKNFVTMSYTENDAKDALLKFEAIKGRDRARKIEQIWRLETEHFKSDQFKLTGTAGMELGNWSNLDESKMRTIKMNDNHLTGAKKSRTFLVWDNLLDFLLYLSDYIDRHDGNIGRWNSTDPGKQAKYINKVDTIIPRFIQ